MEKPKAKRTKFEMKPKKMQITKHAVKSVFTQLPDEKEDESTLTSNTPRHNFCLEILKSGCANSFCEFFNLTKEVDWSENHLSEFDHEQSGEETREHERKRDLFISLPYLKETLCEAEVCHRENKPTEVYEQLKKTATFFKSIGDIPTSLEYYQKAMNTAAENQAPDLQAQAALQLAKGYQSFDELDEATRFYELYLTLISGAGSHDDEIAAKGHLMEVYETKADKLEIEKQQYITAHAQQQQQHGQKSHAGKQRSQKMAFGTSHQMSTAAFTAHRKSINSASGTEHDIDVLGSTISSESSRGGHDDSYSRYVKDSTTASVISLQSAQGGLNQTKDLSATAAADRLLQDEGLKKISEQLAYCLEKFLEMAQACSDAVAEIRALGRLGKHYEQSKDYHKAIEYSTQLLELCQKQGNTNDAGEACHALAGAYTGLGQMEEAVKYLEMRMQIEESAQNDQEATIKSRDIPQQKTPQQAEEDEIREQTSTLGQILIKTGKYEEAIRFFDKNFKSARKSSQLAHEKYQQDQQEMMLNQMGVGDKKKQLKQALKEETPKEGNSPPPQAQPKKQSMFNGPIKIVPQTSSGFVEQARVNLGIARGNHNFLQFIKDVRDQTQSQTGGTPRQSITSRSMQTRPKGGLLLSSNPALEWVKIQASKTDQNAHLRPVRIDLLPASAVFGSVMDEAFVLKVLDLEPVTPVTLQLSVRTPNRFASLSKPPAEDGDTTPDPNEGVWMSIAEFLSDGKGVVSLPTMSPTGGDYQVADAMGLFWSMEKGIRERLKMDEQERRKKESKADEVVEEEEDQIGQINGRTLIVSTMNEATRKAILREREKLSIEEQMAIEEEEEAEKRRMEAEDEEEEDDEELEEAIEMVITLPSDYNGPVPPPQWMINAGMFDPKDDDKTSQEKSGEWEEGLEDPEREVMENEGEMREEGDEERPEGEDQPQEQKEEVRQCIVVKKVIKRGRISNRLEAVMKQDYHTFLDQTRSLQPLEYKIEVILGRDTVVHEGTVKRVWIDEKVEEVENTREWEIEGVDIRAFIPKHEDQAQKDATKRKEGEDKPKSEDPSLVSSETASQKPLEVEPPLSQPTTENAQPGQPAIVSRPSGTGEFLDIPLATPLAGSLASTPELSTPREVEIITLYPIVIIVAAGGGPTLAPGGFVWSAHVAAVLSAHNYATFAIALSDTHIDGTLPKALRQVPLDAVPNLLNYLRTTPPYSYTLDFSNVSFIGYRMGALYGMTLAHKVPGLFHRIIAISPPSHTFEAVRFSEHTKSHPPFLHEGTPLPFLHLPLDDQFFSSIDLTHTSRYYERALARMTPQENEQTIVRIEKFVGKVLLISFEEDLVWPSKAMCDTLEKRMMVQKEKNDRARKKKRGGINFQSTLQQTHLQSSHLHGPSLLGRQMSSAQPVEPDLVSVASSKNEESQSVLPSKEEKPGVFDPSTTRTPPTDGAGQSQRFLGQHNSSLHSTARKLDKTSFMEQQEEKELEWKHICLPISLDLWPPFAPVIGRCGEGPAAKLETISREKDIWNQILRFLE